MKALILAFVVSAMFAAEPPKPWTQEPDSFMGVPFDTSRADLVTLLSNRGEKLGACAPSGGAFICDAPVVTIANISLSPIFTFTPDYKFAGGLGSFPAGDFDAMKDVFVEKYGNPLTAATDAVQTAPGVKYQNLILEWKGKNVDILLAKYGSKVTEGMFDVSTHALKEAHQKARDDAKKSGAGKL